jgi:hypothetical protein
MVGIKKGQVDKQLFQFCILETYVNEVLDLSSDVTIEEVSFEVGFSLKRMVSKVTPDLAALGVTSMREPSASMEAVGKLTGKRSSMLHDAKEICATLGLDYRHMRVKRLVVSCNGARSIFTRMTKKLVHGDENKMKSVKVLGLVVTEGSEKDSANLIKILGAKKVHCQYSTQPVRTVICKM